MALNKRDAYVLLRLLSGDASSSAVSAHLSEMDVRSIQRALARLAKLELVVRHGPSNSPTYTVAYQRLVPAPIAPKLLEDEHRPTTGLHHGFIDWLERTEDDALAQAVGLKTSAADRRSLPMAPKDLEHLTIELSWKSSALEGNTYTLLDTQLLLVEGIRARNRTDFETQMVLNHKDAISFITEHPELFSGDIALASVEELHKRLSRNLAIPTGLRRRPIRITPSNYLPPDNPHQLRELAERVLMTISRTTDVSLKSLLALALIPYLQLFEDGNKRTGRLLANAILISSAGVGFSLRDVDARDLALAYLAFYEFNSMSALVSIFHDQISQTPALSL